jgi:hypothetical protein
MHTPLLDLHGNIPTFISITDGKVHDVNVLDEILPEAGAFYVMDRGYVDFERLYIFTLSAAFFVVRTKSNVLLQRRYSHPVDKATGVRSNHTVILTAIDSAKVYPDPLRRVSYLDTQEIWRSATVIVRSGIDARQVAGWVRAEVAAIDPGLPVEIGLLDQQVSKLAARPRFNAVLLGIFAALGTALAGIGLYGLISFMVAQRTQEIGVRMALGATPGGIVRLVLRHAAGWTAAGAAVGTAGALFVTRLLESTLFSLPWTLAAAVTVLFGVALAAAWIPARHAACVDPVEALRRE